MSGRFEVVRTDAEQPWHARFAAANGRIVWTTEQYARRAGALTAIHAIAAAFSPYGQTRMLDGHVKVLIEHIGDIAHSVEIRDVDERVGSDG